MFWGFFFYYWRFITWRIINWLILGVGGLGYLLRWRIPIMKKDVQIINKLFFFKSNMCARAPACACVRACVLGRVTINVYWARLLTTIWSLVIATIFPVSFSPSNMSYIWKSYWIIFRLHVPVHAFFLKF